MKVSKRGEYGLRALLDLAQHYGSDPVPCADIAARQGIPETFLDQLLLTLRRAGLIRSARGAHGGHTLARPPEQITLGQALAILEGSTAPLDCIDDQTGRGCQIAESCVFRGVWQEVKAATDRILASKTLADLSRHQSTPLASPST